MSCPRHKQWLLPAQQPAALTCGCECEALEGLLAPARGGRRQQAGQLAQPGASQGQAVSRRSRSLAPAGERPAAAPSAVGPRPRPRAAFVAPCQGPCWRSRVSGSASQWPRARPIASSHSHRSQPPGRKVAAATNAAAAPFMAAAVAAAGKATPQVARAFALCRSCPSARVACVWPTGHTQLESARQFLHGA